LKKLLKPALKKRSKSLTERVTETFSVGCHSELSSSKSLFMSFADHGQKPFHEAFIHGELTGPISIRLLALEAGAGGDGKDNALIRCSLREYDVNSAPAYSALSYTWEADP
jgi:hypothetical protein